MHCLPNRIVSRLALFLVAGLVTGISTGADLPEAPDRYEVELIVFRHIDQGRNTPEMPAASSIFRPSPLNLTLTELAQPSPSTHAIPGAFLDEVPDMRPRRPPISFYLIGLHSPYPDFVPLREDTRTLNRLYQRLERIDAYEPIAHVGWVQPARSSDSATPYRFELADADAAGITGTVTLYKSRYLHLEVDLALEAEQPDVKAQILLGAGLDESPDVHKLTESRRIRGSAAHYFDHPRFGVIARIRNLQEAEAERQEAG